ncbi:hypothetical protein, partial [Parafrankia soli]|uniref:hypothetical protein n=1 Tax=Parafrankia soli TaxID=2599596 RepID=UPI001A7E147C
LYAREHLPGSEEGADYQLPILPDEIADIAVTRRAAAWEEHRVGHVRPASVQPAAAEPKARR